MKKEQIQECCYDLGKQPYEIPDSYGEGIVGKEYYTAKEKRPREVMLEITSFRGICGGAVHYYGTLKAYRPKIHKEGSNYCHCGYLGDDTSLFKDLNIVIELWRYITEEEYSNDQKITWDDLSIFPFDWLILFLPSLLCVNFVVIFYT